MRTFTIADPQNWIALLAFMATAIVTSQLSGRARLRTMETLARQRDLEQLYALGRALLLWDGTSPPAQAVASDIAAAFGLPSVALYDRHADAIARAGAADLPDVDAALHEVALQGTCSSRGRIWSSRRFASVARPSAGWRWRERR